MKKRLASLLLLAAFVLPGCSGSSQSPMGAAPSPAATPTPKYYAAADSINGAPNTEEYRSVSEQSFASPANAPLSTFSVSVDTASYSLVRGKLQSGSKVTPDMVRLEEFVNYFNYNYPGPQEGEPLSIYTEAADCPWNEGNIIVQIGIQGERVEMEDAPPCNLVFLVDVSGSMADENKLALAKKSFLLLLENLRDTDRVSIVTYAGSVQTLIDGATGDSKLDIERAIDALSTGGSTNGAGGITTAYDCAARNFIEGGINRVIMATDGDFNVGISSEDALMKLIEEKRDSGVYLSVLGFGMGNYKDNKMETLSKHGNGNASYIDSLLEAEKVLVEEMSGTLYTIAKDVKIQVEFNPKTVSEYRLLGYNNRLLNAEDFLDDSVDAGEIGSGHSVTALYEIVPNKSYAPGIELKYQDASADELAEYLTVSIRYKDPEGDGQGMELKKSVSPEDYLAEPSDRIKWATSVAEFALTLTDSEYAQNASIKSAVLSAVGADLKGDKYKEEFLGILLDYKK